MYSSTEQADATAPNEPALIALAKKGDAAAFGELVRAYQRKAYTVAYGFVRNREDALELAQEAFARAFKAMGRFDASAPFYPWLYRILKNACLNHLKRRRRRGETSLDQLTASGGDVPSGDCGPGDEASADEMRSAVAAAMNRLPPAHREILVLRHFQQLSYAEIAACLGVPQGTVMSRLHAARHHLRSLLEETHRMAL